MSPLARAQPAEHGARALALGHAVTALDDDAWGGANPATWAAHPHRRIVLTAGQAFGLAELRRGAARVGAPVRSTILSLGAATFGFAAYRETELDASVARRVAFGSARPFYLGVRLTLYHVAIPSYGSARALGVSMGGLVEVVPDVYFGIAAVNVNAPRYTALDELPRSLAFGLSYRPVPDVRLVADVVKSYAFPISLRAGLETWPADVLALRAGVAGAPVRFTTGAGIRLGAFAADFAAERHVLLGWTPALTLAVHW